MAVVELISRRHDYNTYIFSFAISADDERPLFTCDICAKSYLSRSGIMQHMDAHRSGTKKE